MWTEKLAKRAEALRARLSTPAPKRPRKKARRRKRRKPSAHARARKCNRANWSRWNRAAYRRRRMRQTGRWISNYRGTSEELYGPPDSPQSTLLRPYLYGV